MDGLFASLFVLPIALLEQFQTCLNLFQFHEFFSIQDFFFLNFQLRSSEIRQKVNFVMIDFDLQPGLLFMKNNYNYLLKYRDSLFTLFLKWKNITFWIINACQSYHFNIIFTNLCLWMINGLPEKLKTQTIFHAGPFFDANG